MSTLPHLPLTELHGFLATIHAEDADGPARLVFADWLDEHADPRGELLRIQVDLARAVHDGDEVRIGTLREREREWQRQWNEQWPGVPFLTPDRGVLRVEMPAEYARNVTDRPDIDALLHLAPWIDLTVTNVNNAIAPVLADSLRRYRVGRVTLRVAMPPLERSGLAQLAELPVEWEITVVGSGQLPASALRPLAALPGLRRLSLPGGTTNGTLTGLAECRRLRRLDLIDCRILTGAGLAHLGRLRELRELRLDECGQLVDADLAPLARLTGLRELHMPFCRRITAEGVRHLRGLTALEVLDLGFLRGLTDDALATVAGLPALRHLHLFFCEGLTDAGLRHLHGHPALRSISLGKCDGLTERGLAALRRALPRLVISR